MSSLLVKEEMFIKDNIFVLYLYLYYLSYSHQVLIGFRLSQIHIHTFKNPTKQVHLQPPTKKNQTTLQNEINSK